MQVKRNYQVESKYAGLLSLGLLAACAFAVSTPRDSRIIPRAYAQTSPAPLKSGRILLPIELLGPNGTTKTCVFTLGQDADSAADLRMEVNGLDYAGKGSVQVNNAPWTELTNDTVDIDEPGKSYGGIGGGYETLWLNVPLTAGLHAGVNTVAFRFDRTDGVSSGFRVLTFNIIDHAGHDLIPSSKFAEDDPDLWTPPFTSAGRIDAGRKLWSTAVLVENDLPGAGNIQAACADCHAADGRDLKYFNYSNESIITRSVFHGLTTVQGKEIASYIRSLPYPNPGRPWNPVYQPGSHLDEKPAIDWSAGAGLKNVLANDADTAGYLLANAHDISPAGNLNLRQLPIALQLLDWNEWLPRIHPKDAWGSVFTSSKVYRDYQSVEDTEPDEKSYAPGGGTHPPSESVLSNAIQQSSSDRNVLKVAFDGWEEDGHLFLKPRSEAAGIRWTPTYAQQCYSTALWQRVKTWELLQTFNLENSPHNPSGETRSWVSGGLFQTSPARLKIPCSDDALTGSRVKYEYLNNAWYELQMITNSGGRAHKGNDPIDWPYLRGRVKDMYTTSRSPQAMRLAAYLIKGIQEGDNGIGPESKFTGWNPLNLADISSLVSPTFAGAWGDTPSDVRARVLTDVCDSWLDKVTQYPPQRYYAAGDARPTQRPGRNINGGPWVDRVFGMLPLLRDDGVASSLLDRIDEWASTVWPNAAEPTS